MQQLAETPPPVKPVSLEVTQRGSSPFTAQDFGIQDPLAVDVNLLGAIGKPPASFHVIPGGGDSLYEQPTRNSRPLWILCSVLFVVGFVVTGIVLAGYDDYVAKEYSTKETVGHVMLFLIVLVCGLGIFGCCAACCASCCDIATCASEEELEPKEPNWVFVRHNSMYRDYVSLQKEILREPERPLPRLVEQLLSQREKNHEMSEIERQKAADESIIDQVKSDLESGLTPKQVRQKLRPKVYLLHFEASVADAIGGDALLQRLRSQISCVLAVGSPFDELLLSLNSPGGEVHFYGAAASQLVRIKNAGLRLTVSVDMIAASGGYMMACVAHRIIAAPFAMVGSIGVLAYQPNFQKVIEKHDVDMYMFTAGEYKRTVDVVGKVTDADVQKMQEELSEIHFAFKEHIRLNRPAVKDISSVSTGEAWLAVRAKEQGLVDEIMTAAEYIAQRCNEADVLELKLWKKKTSSDSLSALLTGLLSGGGGDSSLGSLPCFTTWPLSCRATLSRVMKVAQSFLGNVSMLHGQNVMRHARAVPSARRGPEWMCPEISHSRHAKFHAI